jgi:DNA-directed RNA polymerase specialized sigma subunit
MSDHQNLFRLFVDEMNEALRDNHKVNPDGQAKLFEQLFRAEREFRAALLSTQYGRDMYKAFMDFIVREKGNILHVRPYFRERQGTFSEKMKRAFDDGNPEVLHKFRINFVFASWMMSRWSDPATRVTYRRQKERLDRSYEQIKRIRTLLCENSLPLAINRSKVFWSKVPESHLEYMDLIQNSSEGLLTAIDKFTPPYKTVFRSTAIGRMTLNMMTDYNATMVKLPPKEKRILYRHGVAKNRKNIEDADKVLDFVQESFKGVTQEGLQQIVQAASSVMSLDHRPEDGLSLSEKLSSGDNPEKELQANQQQAGLTQALSTLNVIEGKVMSLKTGYT